MPRKRFASCSMLPPRSADRDAAASTNARQSLAVCVVLAVWSAKESAAASSSAANARAATANSRIDSSARILCRLLLGFEARQVIPLQPRLGHITPGVLGVAHDRDPVRIEAIDDHRFRGPFNAELRLKMAVIRRLQQPVAFGVELRLDRTAAGSVDPHLDVMVSDVRRPGSEQ